MCLKKLHSKTVSCTEGWKVFRVSQNRQLWGECRGKRAVRNVGKWLDENDFRNHKEVSVLFTENSEDYYHTGWHTFTTYEDAETWKGFAFNAKNLVIRKVKIREILCSGTHPLSYSWRKETAEVVVSRYIKIVKGSGKD